MNAPNFDKNTRL